MKFFKQILLLSTSLLLVDSTKAQQDPMYSMYMFDKAIINPAFAGSSNWIVATVKSRNQAIAVSGQEKTQTINVHAPIQKKHIGLGFKLVKDKIAIMNTLNATAMLSYHLGLAGGKLSLGLEAGVFSKKVNYQELVINMRGDNAIPPSTVSSMVPDVSMGMYYQKKQIYLGFSYYHLIKKSFDNGEASSSQSHLAKQINLLGGNVFELSKSLTMEPSFLLKYQPNSTTQLDLNTMLYYNNIIGAGLQYRIGNAVAGILRINIKDSFRICYSYDMNVSKATPYTKGAHEIILSYGFKLPPPPTQKEIHPRYYY